MYEIVERLEVDGHSSEDEHAFQLGIDELTKQINTKTRKKKN